MLTRLFALLLAAMVSLCACAATPAPDAEPQSHHQIIIQFRSPVDDPADAAFVQQLSVDAGATLRFERTLATGAQLYSLGGALDAAQLREVVQQLSRRPDVMYAEEDRRVQAAPEK